MLFELEPSQEVTGGAWYTNDREFDTVFIDLLMEQCYKLIRSKVTTPKMPMSHQLRDMLPWSKSANSSKPVESLRWNLVEKISRPS